MELIIKKEGPFSLHHQGPIVFEFTAWENPKWQGSVERGEQGSYTLKTNGEPLPPMGISQLAYYINIITNGGRS